MAHRPDCHELDDVVKTEIQARARGAASIDLQRALPAALRVWRCHRLAMRGRALTGQAVGSKPTSAWCSGIRHDGQPVKQRKMNSLLRHC